MAELEKYWGELGAVDITPLLPAVTVAEWPPVKGGQPNRVRIPDEAYPVANAVLWFFDCPVMFDAYYACLSRLVPGATYELHKDPQRQGWLTRVHVPLTTNPGCWMYFEGQGKRVHFECGKAYSFNTLESHHYANDGSADRVHLLFDVYRAADVTPG